jgi:predicted transcriptional regulator
VALDEPIGGHGSDAVSRAVRTLAREGLVEREESNRLELRARLPLS